MTIHNSTELCKAYGCETKEELEHDLYKYTECGMAIWFKEEESVTITGYVENDSDYCGPSETFTYPFEFEEFTKIADVLNDKACRIWEILNGDEYADEDEDVKWEMVTDIECFG